MPHLDDLAIKYKSDKSTSVGNSHAYTLIYEMLFRLGRNANLNILEIGLCIGGPENDGDIDRKVTGAPSISMWKEYFPNSHIYGFDISDFSAFEDARFTFIRGDCGVKSDLGKATKLGKEFDVIIDDASHASFHQFMTMSVLWSSLKPGGLYIVEDLDWQPKQYEETLPPIPKFGPYFKHLIETGKFPDTHLPVDDFAQIKDEIYFAWVFSVNELRRMRAFHRAQHATTLGTRDDLPREPSWLRRTLRKLLKGRGDKMPYLAIIQKA